MRFTRGSSRPAARAGALALLLSLTAVASAAAQNAECDRYGDSPLEARARRRCDAGVDAARLFNPVIGILVAGGNPVTGSANTLGGLGHFSFSLLRANATSVVIPDLEFDGTTNVVGVDETIFAPAPQLDVAAGLYPGLRGGLLSVDALLSAQLLPTEDVIDQMRVSDDAARIGPVALGLGLGARVGVLRDEGPLPAVSFSVMVRNLPEMGYGSLAGGDDFAFTVDHKNTSFRAMASKTFSALTVAGGFGVDKYSGSAVIDYRNPITGLPEPRLDVEFDDTRSVLFLDAAVQLGPVQLVGEVGRQSGTDREFVTDFDDVDENGGRTFYGAGVRFAF